jgi:hypothetical protein
VMAIITVFKSSFQSGFVVMFNSKFGF